MSSEKPRGREYRDFLAAIDADEGFYIECTHGHGSLPPCRVCSTCGTTELDEQSLPKTGTIQAHTVVHVPTEEFDGEAPYVTAIAEFGAVNLTGMIVGLDPEAVENGMEVTVELSEISDSMEPALTFVPL